jgi:hypothetical protein
MTDIANKFKDYGVFNDRRISNFSKKLDKLKGDGGNPKTFFAQLSQVFRWLFNPGLFNGDASAHLAGLTLLVFEKSFKDPSSDSKYCPIGKNFASGAIRLVILPVLMIHMLILGVLGDSWLDTEVIKRNFTSNLWLACLLSVSLHAALICGMIFAPQLMALWVALMFGLLVTPLLIKLSEKGFLKPLSKRIFFPWEFLFDISGPVLLGFSIDLMTSPAWVPAFLSSHLLFASFVLLLANVLMNFQGKNQRDVDQSIKRSLENLPLLLKILAPSLLLLLVYWLIPSTLLVSILIPMVLLMANFIRPSTNSAIKLMDYFAIVVSAVMSGILYPASHTAVAALLGVWSGSAALIGVITVMFVLAQTYLWWVLLKPSDSASAAESAEISQDNRESGQQISFFKSPRQWLEQHGFSVLVNAVLVNALVSMFVGAAGTETFIQALIPGFTFGSWGASIFWILGIIAVIGGVYSSWKFTAPAIEKAFAKFMQKNKKQLKTWVPFIVAVFPAIAVAYMEAHVIFASGLSAGLSVGLGVSVFIVTLAVCTLMLGGVIEKYQNDILGFFVGMKGFFTDELNDEKKIIVAGLVIGGGAMIAVGVLSISPIIVAILAALFSAITKAAITNDADTFSRRCWYGLKLFTAMAGALTSGIEAYHLIATLPIACPAFVLTTLAIIIASLLVMTWGLIFWKEGMRPTLDKVKGYQTALNTLQGEQNSLSLSDIRQKNFNLTHVRHEDIVNNKNWKIDDNSKNEVKYIRQGIASSNI